MEISHGSIPSGAFAKSSQRIVANTFIYNKKNKGKKGVWGQSTKIDLRLH